MKKIAIAGTIASGKTSVSSLLRQRGIPVFNCDQYAKRALHDNNPCQPRLVEILGQDVLDCNHDIDAKKMAECIFNNEEARKAVNAVVHPYVKEAMHHFFASHEKEPLVCAEVPLLFEAHWEDEFDSIMVVTCTKEHALERMMQDRGYSQEEAEQRYQAAVDPSVQTEHADIVIHNDGTRKELAAEINQWIGRIRREAHHGDQA